MSLKKDRLIAWIDSHYPPSPTIDNGDGTLTVFTEWVHLDSGKVTVGSDVINATVADARDHLGY